MTPKTIGPYQVLERIGAGGMGEVYRARDTRLDREVAIKLLPETAPSDPQTLARFRLEARTASALNHPNICTIHDVGEHEGRPYFVMELLDGETLDRILRNGPLAPQRCLELALQLSEGLEAAHAKSILHRDLKPANISVTQRGSLKILDFGVAKLAGPAAQSDQVDETVVADLTTPGFAVGTAAYMSPEQALGKPLDARSDLFSLGVVVHEMATGSRAFSGGTAAAVSEAILHATPSGAVPSTLAGLRPILDRLLQKDPSRRYASASELKEDLRKLSADAVPSRETTPSIAVLPFVNMSPDPENEYFTDGMAEEILGALSKVESLRVASRTSSFAFKARGEDVRAIGRMLGVGSILEGSVRRSGKRLRISVQLVNVEDGYRIWSDRYDRELEDVFAVQDEIAENVTSALKIVLTDRERHVIRKVPTQNMEAYDLYLRGRDLVRTLEVHAFEAARKMFEKATELDPQFALAWVGIVESCHWLYTWIAGNPELLAVAQAASAKAIALDPELSEAHVAIGLTHFMSDDHPNARLAFQRAMQLDPQGFDAYYYSARSFVSDGHLEEAAAMFSKASEIRPEDYVSLALLSTLYMGLGRPDDMRKTAVRALEVVERHLELYPNDSRALYLGAGAAWFAHRDRDRALQWSQRALDLEPESLAVRYNVACVYANIGEFDAALDLIERNVEKGWGQRSWLEHDPDMRALRDQPRFHALLEKIERRG